LNRRRFFWILFGAPLCLLPLPALAKAAPTGGIQAFWDAEDFGPEWKRLNNSWLLWNESTKQFKSDDEWFRARTFKMKLSVGKEIANG